jgi:cell wall-associated NlpC family hydrolase
MKAAEFCEKVTGIPWVNRGESFDGMDCWGLCILSFREIDGIELPQISGYADKSKSTGEAVTQTDLDKFTESQPTDGAIMTIFNNHGKMVHVGRCLCGRVLHSTEALGVRWETYQAINSRNRNVRYFKYD